jgi:hypothetical protein
MFGFHIIPEVKISDLLTSISITVALIAFLYAWSKDRRIRSREEANVVRTAAANTLAKVDRSETLLLSLFDLIHPVITEADELIVKTQDAIACRDFFGEDSTNYIHPLLLNFPTSKLNYLMRHYFLIRRESTTSSGRRSKPPEPPTRHPLLFYPGSAKTYFSNYTKISKAIDAPLQARYLETHYATFAENINQNLERTFVNLLVE